MTMDSTDRFVLEERDNARKQTTIRLVAFGALSLVGLLVFSSARCSAHQAEEETKQAEEKTKQDELRIKALPMDAELARIATDKAEVEARVKQAQIQADEAVRIAETQKRAEMEARRLELYASCREEFPTDHCDRVYQPERLRAEQKDENETKRALLLKELYDRCLASDVSDKHCDEKATKMVQSIGPLR